MKRQYGVPGRSQDALGDRDGATPIRWRGFSERNGAYGVVGVRDEAQKQPSQVYFDVVD